MVGCLNCTSFSNCSLCDYLYVLNETECIADCAMVSYCNTCQISLNQSEYVECLSCSNGYSVDSANNTCIPVCGDGLMAPE